MNSKAQTADGVSIRRLDVNQYMLTWLGTDKHTPDMISWVLLKRYGDSVSFVATKKVGLEQDNMIDMEVRLKGLHDVAELVAAAALQASQSVASLAHAFDIALKNNLK